MQHSVIENREDYLGGSDIPALLGISPYKTRFQLLKEKAHIVPVQPVFANKAIQYGVTMEPKIRDYLNQDRDPEDMFKEWKFERPFEGSTLRARGHLDGYAAKSKTCLEIKTTDQIKGDYLRDYASYLFQMLFYMDQPRPRLKSGILAVYERPDDYNETFDPDRLHIFRFDMSEPYIKGEVKKLRLEIYKFLADLQFMICNPDKCELELMDIELKKASEKVLAFEKTVAELKEKEAQLKEMKAELTRLMNEYGVPSIDAGEYKISFVKETPAAAETVKKCDIESLELFFPDAAAECVTTETIIKTGRSATVRISKKKGAAND